MGGAMNALVEQTSLGVTTSSRTVAEVFEKEHRDVLRSVDAIVEHRPELCARNFARTSAQVPMPNGGCREVRAYDMDRDGFTLLAMGFTGEKALDWKIAFIDAFKRMEEELAGRARPPAALDPIELAPALAVVREARMLFGRPVARRLWPQLGLPEVTRTDEIRFELATGYELPESIRGWIEHCVLIDAAAQCHAAALFQSYERWCGDNDERAENQTVFGRALTHMGYPAKKSPTGNTLRVGLKLIA